MPRVKYRDLAGRRTVGSGVLIAVAVRLATVILNTLFGVSSRGGRTMLSYIVQYSRGEKIGWREFARAVVCPQHAAGKMQWSGGPAGERLGVGIEVLIGVAQLAIVASTAPGVMLPEARLTWRTALLLYRMYRVNCRKFIAGLYRADMGVYCGKTSRPMKIYLLLRIGLLT